jgi:hypothetical protein
MALCDTRREAFTERHMQTVFTPAGKVAGFIIPRGRTGFEAFTADEKAAGMFETQHRAATALRQQAAECLPDGAPAPAGLGRYEPTINHPLFTSP